jgi:hypothetical protein
MERKVATYSIISMPANQFRVSTKLNLLTNNPGEIAPSDVASLDNNTDNYKYPAAQIISMPANQFRTVLQSNLLTNNPQERAGNEQLFTRTIYETLSYGENQNAFRDGVFSAGALRPAPQKRKNEDNKGFGQSQDTPKILIYGRKLVY